MHTQGLGFQILFMAVLMLLCLSVDSLGTILGSYNIVQIATRSAMQIFDMQIYDT